MKIKPEDLKNYIGKKIVHPNYRFVVTLLAVGDRKIFVKDACNDEGTYYISEYLWETYEELKKKVKLEQWIFKNGIEYYIHSRLFDYDPMKMIFHSDVGRPIKCIATYEVDE